MPAIQSRHWCFTLNGIIEEEVGWLTEKIPQTDYCVWQYERAPTTGQIHIQGYCIFDRKKTLNSAKKIIHEWSGIQGHLERARGNPQQNKEYCTKDATRIGGGGPFEFGDIRGEGQGKSKALVQAWDIFRAQGLTDELIENYPSQLIIFGDKMKRTKQEIDTRHWVHRQGFHKKNVIILWGETETGKTRMANEAGAVWANYTSRYTWGHYLGEPVVGFDEFTGQVPIEEMLKLLDGYPQTVQIPYLGNKPWIPHTVFICSNVEPCNFWNDPKKPVRDEQFRAFMRRVCEVIKFEKTALGVLKTWQKGHPVEEPDGFVIEDGDQDVVQ